MYTEITQCRICGSNHLRHILSLGNQALTGVFPKSTSDVLTSGPLELVKCDESTGGCGLLQLKHSYESSEMYGENYGYRSSLNRSMARHLQAKVARILSLTTVKAGDLVIDIGSNDSTLLQAYPESEKLDLVGIDPTGVKFKSYYPPHIRLIPDFFSEGIVRTHLGEKKAKIITSIAMFYDLEQPLEFMNDVCNVLADDGIWVFEQSYMPTMLQAISYDTICHEHLEYYAFKQIHWMANSVGLKVIDVEFNNINGGSFSIVVAKQGSHYSENTALIATILSQEASLGLDALPTFESFKHSVFEHKNQLLDTLRQIKAEGKLVLGYGASTKGNVILQFCGITKDDLPAIAEVNQEKFGCFTPGTHIPIISEEEARAMNPDYFLVLPWHFRDNIIEREQAYLQQGGKLLFPLPQIDIVG
jgi:NDP-4-keto-2,6-dideoxyhexose 3-C-methyltransferase